MKTVVTDHILTIRPEFVRTSVIGELGKYDEYRQLRCGAVYEFFKDGLKWAVLLNKNKLRVYDARMDVIDAVNETLDKYYVRIEWSVKEDVDDEKYACEISRWLTECPGMVSKHIEKIERMYRI